jgi:hypothetical protein
MRTGCSTRQGAAGHAGALRVRDAAGRRARHLHLSRLDARAHQAARRGWGEADAVLPAPTRRRVNRAQHDFVRASAGLPAEEIAFLLEPLVYRWSRTAAAGLYIEDPAKRPELVIETVREFARPEYGIDIFKLETPVAADQVPAPEEESSAVADARRGSADRRAARPALGDALGGAGMEPFRAS